MLAIGIGGLVLTACIPQGTAPARTAPPEEPRRDVFGNADRAANTEPVRALPDAPPAWEARRATADGRVIADSNYTVQPGDTLRAISEHTGAGSEAIARVNGLAAPYIIRPGQRLAIPGGRYHLVRAGETGIAIARAYGVRWGDVVTANALEDPYTLRIGQRVLIPGGDASAPTAATAATTSRAADRAARFQLNIEDIVTGGEPAIADNAPPPRALPTRARPLPSTAAVTAPPALREGFQWPANGTILARFGKGQSGERNDGIKIGLPLGTPVVAANDGVVIYAGSEVPALGGLVMLRHSNGLITVYGHASELLVQRGQTVKRGQAVVLSGDSGFAPRPQLHFEMRAGRTAVDPLARLPER